MLAARVFAERQAACDRDRGRLWGVSLCGPLLFVDPATRAVVANRDSASLHGTARDGVVVGTLPASIVVANTAFALDGERWSMVVWPLPDDPIARGILVMHESWHRMQDSVGLPAANPPNDHLDTADGRFWLAAGVARARARARRVRRGSAAPPSPMRSTFARSACGCFPVRRRPRTR